MTADLREPDEVDRVVDEALAGFGSVDVLVNNAGGQFAAPAEEITANGWRAVHRIAVDATWAMTHAVATRSMIPNRRGVVFFLGFSPRRGIAGMVHACAARAAVENLAAGLALEWSRYGIRTICLAPGTIATPALSEGYPPEDVDAVGTRRTPRPARPARGGLRASSARWRRRSGPTSPAPRSPSTAASTPGAPESPHHRSRPTSTDTHRGDTAWTSPTPRGWPS